jgi:hypothetical protein
VNRDHALFYELNESVQSKAGRSGFWTRDHPADAGKDDNQQGQLRDRAWRVRFTQSCKKGSCYSSGHGGPFLA